MEDKIWVLCKKKKKKILTGLNGLTGNILSSHRKSFFSGHASFSMFTMLYLAVSNN